MNVVIATVRRALAVPWALDEAGRVLSPESADKRTDYRCPTPGCGARLRLRAGTKRVRRHFAHVGGGTCSTESVIHWAAKFKIAEVVSDWVHGRGQSPRFIRQCGTCGNLRPQSLARTRVAAAVVERVVDGFRPDVVLTDAHGTAKAAIEVYVTHEVGEAKRARLNVPWVELGAEEVLKKPLVWRPREDFLRPLQCNHVRQRPRLAPGEYVWEVNGGSGGYDRRTFKAHRHAINWMASYLRRGVEMGFYGPRQTVRVVMQAIDGRLLARWRNGVWIDEPSFSPYPPGVELEPELD